MPKIEKNRKIEMPKLVESDGRKSKIKSANQKDMRSFFFPCVTEMIERDMMHVKKRRKIVKASYRLKNTIIQGGFFTVPP